MAVDKALFKSLAVVLPIGIVGGVVNGLLGGPVNGGGGFGAGLSLGSMIGIEMTRRELAKRADEIHRETQANIDRIRRDGSDLRDRLRDLELRNEREDDYRMEQNERGAP